MRRLRDRIIGLIFAFSFCAVFWLLFFLCIDSVSAEGTSPITKRAVIHHTASPCWTTVQDIDNWHKERGWDEIGYHYVITCDGTVHKGRSLDKQGAHAKGRNDRVGIALVGYDEFTSVQIQALKLLLHQIGVQDAERHHKECPSEGIDVESMLYE